MFGRVLHTFLNNKQIAHIMSDGNTLTLSQ